MRRTSPFARLALLLSALLPGRASAGVDYNRDVRPILAEHCFICHGPDKAKRKASLRLDTEEGVRSAVTGKPLEGELFHRINTTDLDERMPPRSRRALSVAEIDLLKRWLAEGGKWEHHWAFRPPYRPPVPVILHPRSALRTPVDAFLLKSLAEKGLAAAPEADRRTLIRRATFDLTGLPPTPEEVDAFLKDNSPDAYEQLIDRLLASPGYGERWARHWLDVVRFADSNGYEMNNPRGTSWPYRDWAVRAFNEDLPYPRMILEQLAGDTIVGADVLTQAATGFLVGGPHDTVFTALPAANLQKRADDLDDMVTAAGSAFLGLTVNCARCHDHKFDPVTMKDYYALQAVFAGVQHSDREVRGMTRRIPSPELLRLRREVARIERLLDSHEATADPESNEARRPPVNAVCNVERLRDPVDARFVRLTIYATSDRAAPAIDEIEVYTAEEVPENVALASGGAKVTASSTLEGNPFHKLAHLIDGRHGVSFSWVSAELGKGTITLELPRVRRIDRILWGRDRQDRLRDRLAIDYQVEVATEPGKWTMIANSADRRRYNSADPPEPSVPPGLSTAQERNYRDLVVRRTQLLAQLPGEGPGLVAYAGAFLQPGPTHILARGDPTRPGEKVSPGGIVSLRPALTIAADSPEAERRLALARWLAHPDNPLTARVMVNRVWQYHFGQGLVSTPSDFGFSGTPPSHPELLDWLGSEFVRQGWQLKPLHRLIMLSSAYRRSGQGDEKAMQVDRDNRLLWRMTPRRVEAEAIRDSLLAVSGRLDRRMGGLGYYLWEPSTNYVTEYRPKKKLEPDDYRRMVYQLKPRSQQDPTFGVFDCPDASTARPKRTVSITVLQALNLLNATFTVEQSAVFARRVEREAGEDVPRQVERAFRLAFGRGPSEREAKASAAVVRAHGLPALCRALYNSNEFLYVD